MDKELSTLIAAFSNLNLCSIYFIPANREKSGGIFSPLSFSITNLSTSASNANPTLHSFSTINFENYEVLLVRSSTTARKNLIDACPNLKIIGRGGVGMDNIDEYVNVDNKLVQLFLISVSFFL